MSDTDTDTQSNSTITQVNIDQVLQVLEDASIECYETKDFISFSTVLDIHLSDPSIYTEEERYDILMKLNEIFNANHDLVYEVGWDIPPILIAFFNCEMKPVFGLMKEKTTVLILKLFEIMSFHGNPKEMLLPCCELISGLKQDDPYTEEFISSLESREDRYFYREKPLRVYMLKFHSLLQLISSCLRRNQTIVPSRFLSMVISKLISFLNSDPEHSRQITVSRRLYTFLRDYVPPDIPDNNQDSIDDLRIVLKQENALQRKLLVFFYSVLIDHLTKPMVPQLINHIYPNMLNPEQKNQLDFLEDFEMMSRFCGLGLSMDLDYPNSYKFEVDKSIELFNQCKKPLNNSDDIFELVIQDYNLTKNRTIAEGLPSLSTSSIVFLYTYYQLIDKPKFFQFPKISFVELVKFQLYTYVPFILNPKLCNLSVVASLMIQTLNSLNDKSLIELNQEQIHSQFESNESGKTILFSYLQYSTTLVFNSNDKLLIKLYFTLLIKIMINLKEEISYQFIFDSLLNCPPFDGFQVGLIGILKDLLMNDRIKVVTKSESETTTNTNTNTNINTEPIEDKLETLKLSGSAPPPPPPVLPPRVTKYIRLTDERANDLMLLFDVFLEETFLINEETEEVELELQTDKLNSLLALLNLINSVRSFPVELVTPRLKDLETNVEKFTNYKVNVDDYLAFITFNVDKAKRFYGVK
ncbi:hypothetical protein CANARDRAFT_9991 [[Candida] arabinofermentans NRRL YB-2248]|uniref:Uncharacterized protein n=1 Tax=[Candida] arabinofermentans NRRL YB-2248 TaxID=983967 RepID=A0A1E4SU27_9ASCO|nr:hypothetical protein CANARDRAFT_9991 [[Candida] arabinofermentans NRRL YB-2248]